MGIMMSRLFETLFGSKEVRILILGLDNAGKTTLSQLLQGNTSVLQVPPVPTCHTSTAQVILDGNVHCALFDLGGKTPPRRSLLPDYLQIAQGIVYVVDAADPNRFAQAKEQLAVLLALLSRPEMRSVNHDDEQGGCLNGRFQEGSCRGARHYQND